MGPAKDKHGVRESFAKVKFLFAKNGRSGFKEFWSTTIKINMISKKIARTKGQDEKRHKKSSEQGSGASGSPGRIPRTFPFFLGNQGNNPGRFRTRTQGHNVYFASVGLFGLPVWNFQHNLLRRMCSIATSVVPVFCCYWEWLWLWLLLLSSRLSLLSSLSSLAAGVHIFKLRIVQHDRLADLVSQWLCDVLTCNTTKWTSAVRTFQTCQLVEHVSLANVQWNPHQSFDSA